MPVVRYKGVVPAGIAEGSGPADWIANLHLEGDLSRLAVIETAGPAAAFFSATWNAALGIATLRPDASLDYEGFSAAGALPEVEIALRFVFNDGTRQEDGPSFRVAVLDRDDTPPAGLAFASGGDVAAGEIGAVIGTLSVSDPDSAGPFHVSFTAEDDWRFEVVDGVLKLRDGITLGWDDMPVRPILVEVSDGTQSAAFLLEVAVTEPAVPAYTPPLLAAGETRADVTLVGPREALTMRPVEEAVVLAPDPAGVRQVVIDGAGEVWLGPVDRLRFADGWLGPAAEGPAAQAAAMHRAILGEDADGAALAPVVASLRAGAVWVEVAETCSTPRRPWPPWTTWISCPSCSVRRWAPAPAPRTSRCTPRGLPEAPRAPSSRPTSRCHRRRWRGSRRRRLRGTGWPSLSTKPRACRSGLPSMKQLPRRPSPTRPVGSCDRQSVAQGPHPTKPPGRKPSLRRNGTGTLHRQ
jgi:hypothetical protein